MDHEFFKTQQTAAIYVGNGLEQEMLEEFELHLMTCRVCLDDVEICRAIKDKMPGRRTAVPPRSRHITPLADWRMAASLLGAGVLGAAGGWVGQEATRGPDVDSTQTVVFNLPNTTRSADECTVLRLGADTRFAVLRVPGVPSGLVIAALDAEMHPLPAGRYATRAQPDGSYLVRMDSQLLAGRAVYLQTHRGDGAGGEPLGCIRGELPPKDVVR